MPRCLIALGANLGDRAQTLANAVERLRQTAGIEVLSVSRWHATAPIGGPAEQQDFLNGAALLETTLPPGQIQLVLFSIENSLGRVRGERWSARAIDLDLLLYDDLIVNTSELVVPHPRMAFRRFVMEPAVEIAGGMIHPEIGWSLARINQNLCAPLNYVAITGAPGVGKTKLAQNLADQLGGIALLDAIDARQNSGDEVELSAKEINRLERRAALITQHASTDDRVLVSDFWLQQTLAYAQVNGTPLSIPDYDRAVRRAITTPYPKLIIVLPTVQRRAATATASLKCDSWSSRFVSRFPFFRRRARLRTDPDNERIAAAITALANGGSWGPVLWLPADEPDQALTEAVAAVQAMTTATRPID